jgi:MFS transporter, YNFM family, putative membrane transport protein
MLGSIVFAMAIGASLIESLTVIAVSLIGVCAGFFAIHAAAVGLLNRRLSTSRGRANSLYVLSYYAGGAAGITACGYAYAAHGWSGSAILNALVLLLPFTIGILEIVNEHRRWPGHRS